MFVPESKTPLASEVEKDVLRRSLSQAHRQLPTEKGLFERGCIVHEGKEGHLPHHNAKKSGRRATRHLRHMFVMFMVNQAANDAMH